MLSSISWQLLHGCTPRNLPVINKRHLHSLSGDVFTRKGDCVYLRSTMNQESLPMRACPDGSLGAFFLVRDSTQLSKPFALRNLAPSGRSRWLFLLLGYKALLLTSRPYCRFKKIMQLPGSSLSSSTPVLVATVPLFSWAQLCKRRAHPRDAPRGIIILTNNTCHSLVI